MIPNPALINNQALINIGLNAIGVGIGSKNNLKPHYLYIAHFVDLDETNKKVYEGHLPRSLLWDAEGTGGTVIWILKFGV